MVRPTMALQKTKHLQRPFSAISAAPLRSPNLALPATFLTPHIASTPSIRPFHSTQAQRAKPAPLASQKKQRREQESAHAQSWARAGKPIYTVDHDGLSYIKGKPEELPEVMVETLAATEVLHQAGVRDGIIPKAISKKKFDEVVARLVRASFENSPNANAITSISADVDAVWRIGYMATQSSPTALRLWILHSCARAKAKIPVVLVARQQLRDDAVPVDTKWNIEVARLSAQGYPPAMLLQAKILGLRGKFEEALALLNGKIIPHLVASRDRPNPVEDILLAGQIESPYRLGALLYASLAARLEAQGKPGAEELFRKSDEWTKKAALQYNDLEALIDHASLMMNEKNYDMYEESMSKAASGGSGKACLFLANFYFRTSLGEFPMRRQRELPGYSPNERSTWALDSKKDDKTALGRFWKWWAAPIEASLEEYKDLAFEWYITASEYRDFRAAMMIALILRDNQEYKEGMIFVEKFLELGLDSHAEYGPKIMEIARNWNDVNYEPAIPKRLLPVR